MRGCVCRRVRACVVRFLCVLFRSDTWKLQVFPSLVCRSWAVGTITSWIPPGECVLLSITPKKVVMFSPQPHPYPPLTTPWLRKQVTQWLCSARLGSIWVACVRVCGSVCVESWEFAQMHPPLFFSFFCVCLNVCVHMCVSDFCCFCNKTPEVSRRLSGVTERKPGLLHRKCFCIVAPLQQCVPELLLWLLWRSCSRLAGGIQFMAKGWLPFQSFSCDANFQF